MSTYFAMVGKLAIDIDRNCTILMYDRQIEYPVGQFDIVSDTYNTLKQKCVDEYGSEAKDLLDMTYIIPFFDMGVFRRLGDNEVIGSAIEFVDGEGNFIPHSFFVTERRVEAE